MSSFFYSFEGRIFKGRLIARDETQQQVVCMLFNQLIILFSQSLIHSLAHSKRKLLSHSCTHENPARIHHSSNGAVIKRMALQSVLIIIRNFLKGENTMMLYYGKKKSVTSFPHILDFLLHIYFFVASL